jgi:hypothetical protein
MRVVVPDILPRYDAEFREGAVRIVREEESKSVRPPLTLSVRCSPTGAIAVAVRHLWAVTLSSARSGPDVLGRSETSTPATRPFRNVHLCRPALSLSLSHTHTAESVLGAAKPAHGEPGRVGVAR